jgi:predicted aldo/keto reductase-like oxidoreductase
MEFCQIQLNYLDWSFQHAKEKVDLLNQYKIPVWVMEPVRGGSLVSLSDDDTAVLKSLRPNEAIPAWAFKFLQTIPNIMVTLSGMSNFEQLQENINTFNEDKPLSKHEFDALLNIADGMTKKIAVPCTACGYCVSHCSRKLNIPNLLELYNEHSYTINAGQMAFIAPMALAAIEENKKPNACTDCKKCEAVCPQNIEIAKVLSDFTEKLKA